MFLTACEPGGQVASDSLGPVIDEVEAPAVRFVEHAQPPQLQPIEFDQVAGTDRCRTSCVAEWQAIFTGCARGNVDVNHCRNVAHEQVDVCINLICVSRADQPAARCTAGCEDEARGAALECVDDQGFSASCLREGDAVYRTCFEARCGEASPFQGGISYAEVAEGPAKFDDGSEQIPQAQDEETSCSDKCQALDLKIYLACVDDESESPDSCREKSGEAAHACVVEHCQAP